MSCRERLFFSAALMVLLIPLVAPSTAQESATDGEVLQPELVFGETIDVRVVNVEVWVTDRQGNPIAGLTADDFELRENKRPVTITNFYEYLDGREVSAESEPESEPADRPRRRDDLRASHPGAEMSDVPADQRLSLMVYVDHFNLTARGRNQVLPYLREFLSSKLDRDDRVMLVTYNRPPLEVIVPLTTDASMIADATYELESHTGGRSRTDSERIDILRELNRDRVEYANAIGLVRQYAEKVTTDLRYTLEGLREAIRMMAGLPGRKAILYLSNGLPMRSAEDLFLAIDERFSNDRGQWRQNADLLQDPSNAALEIYQHNSARRFNEISSLANANRVTLYTLDAAGGIRQDGASTADLRFSSSIESRHTFNLQDSMLRMAEQTGGRAIVNTRNFRQGLNKISSDFENRYSLGYSPGHGGTGRTFAIEVDLKKETRQRTDRKLFVRYRNSYVDKPIKQAMEDATLAALTMGYESNPLGIRVEEKPGADRQLKREDGGFLVNMLVLIPIGGVTLIPVGEDFEPRISVYAQVIDDQGNTSEVSEQSVPMQVKGADLEPAREKFWPFPLKLRMEADEQKVAIAVRDDLSAKVFRF